MLTAKLQTANTSEHKPSGRFTTMSEIEVSAYKFHSVTTEVLLCLAIIVAVVAL